MTINDVVWPFPVPPVCTGLWEDDDWIRYALLCRPRGYTGDIFDHAAYNNYLEEKC